MGRCAGTCRRNGGAPHGHDPSPRDDHLDARAVHRRAHRLRPGPLEDLRQQRRRVPQGARPEPRSRRRHGGLGRHLGTPALRLVRPEPRRADHHRLQHLGRQVGPHLHLHAAARRHDRRRRRRRPRGQELQGAGARGRGRNRRQPRAGKGVRKHRQGHRSPQQRGEGRQSSRRRQAASSAYGARAAGVAARSRAGARLSLRGHRRN